MGLVEACDAHQYGFNVESCFYLNPQKYVNIILSRGCADRCPVVIIEFCNLPRKGLTRLRTLV